MGHRTSRIDTRNSGTGPSPAGFVRPTIPRMTPPHPKARENSVYPRTVRAEMESFHFRGLIGQKLVW